MITQQQENQKSLVVDTFFIWIRVITKKTECYAQHKTITFSQISFFTSSFKRIFLKIPFQLKCEFMWRFEYSKSSSKPWYNAIQTLVISLYL